MSIMLLIFGIALGLWVGWGIWRRPHLNYCHTPCERLPDGYCARCHSEMHI